VVGVGRGLRENKRFVHSMDRSGKDYGVSNSYLYKSQNKSLIIETTKYVNIEISTNYFLF
jgi:hypothetical protein